jgi:ribosomal protein L32
MLQRWLEHVLLRWTALANVRVTPALTTTTTTTTATSLFPDTSHVWFAVPKSRVTRHKKRLKTTAQKRLPLRQDIVTDPRTGELTRLHRLPFNWRDYLPGKEA